MGVMFSVGREERIGVLREGEGDGEEQSKSMPDGDGAEDDVATDAVGFAVGQTVTNVIAAVAEPVVSPAVVEVSGVASVVHMQKVVYVAVSHCSVRPKLQRHNSTPMRLPGHDHVPHGALLEDGRSLAQPSVQEYPYYPQHVHQHL